MSALRAALAVLALEQPVAVPPSPADGLAQGIRLIAQTPTLVTAFHRLRTGQKPILPRKSLGFAANFLTMLTGVPPAPESERTLETALILRADNELNPSTFAARVTAATGADVYSSVIAGCVCVGRTEARLARPKRVDRAGGDRLTGAGGAWARERLAAKRKIPGLVMWSMPARTRAPRPSVPSQKRSASGRKCGLCFGPRRNLRPR